jgi:hypothetical protein
MYLIGAILYNINCTAALAGEVLQDSSVKPSRRGVGSNRRPGRIEFSHPENAGACGVRAVARRASREEA